MRRDRKPRRPLALLALLLVALGAAFPYFEQVRNANERPRLMQGIALADAQQWAIDGPAMRGLEAGPDVARSPADGRLYPNKPPGASVVAAGAYALGEVTGAALDRPLTLRGYTWWARFLGGLLPTVLLCLWAFHRYRDVAGDAAAAVAVVVYALGTPVASYAHLFYGHQLAACLLFLGITLSADGVDHRRALHAALGGLCAGAAVAVEYGAVFAGLPIAVMLLLGVRRAGAIRSSAAAVAGALVPIALLAAYQDAVFGSPFATGYHHVVDPSFAEKHAVGLLGLSWPDGENLWIHLLSHEAGLLWWAPLCVAGIWGLAELAFGDGARSTDARLHLAVFLLLLLIGSGLSFQGGWRVGPRYLVIALPGLMLGLAHVFARIREHAVALGSFIALASYSVLLNGLAANLWPHFDLDNINSPVAEVLLPLLGHGYEPYGPPWLLGLPGSAWLPIGVGLLGTWWFVYEAIAPTMPRIAAAATGAVLGVIAVWMLPLVVEPHELGARNLAYIERVYEPALDAAEFPSSASVAGPVVTLVPPGS